ncbi:hypothetical protein [Methylobacillus sp. Pita1]|uniref:hypothetical protein n=1 Tax=Methylobacillus sp. Pita1 TaxID=3382642 RepID=UPI0038B546B7
MDLISIWQLLCRRERTGQGMGCWNGFLVFFYIKQGLVFLFFEGDAGWKTIKKPASGRFLLELRRQCQNIDSLARGFGLNATQWFVDVHFNTETFDSGTACALTWADAQVSLHRKTLGTAIVFTVLKCYVATR